MIKIIVFANFDNNQTHLKNNFLNCYCKGENNYLDKIQFTDKKEEATHAIVLNETICPLKLPKENVIGLAYEPREILRFNNNYYNYVKNNLNRYLIGCDMKKENFVNHYSFMWSDQKRDLYFKKHEYEKKYIMSIIVSEKARFFGHKYRRVLSRKILESDLDIHIYGRGADALNYKKEGRRMTKLNDKRIKGKFGEYEPYENYYYTIAIENLQYDSYISEKFCKPLAVDCVPIYWGGKKVDKYFGEKCCYKLSGDVDSDFQLIKNIYLNYQENYLI